MHVCASSFSLTFVKKNYSAEKIFTFECEGKEKEMKKIFKLCFWLMLAFFVGYILFSFNRI